jgi:divalent metal cation (Fe/Co/Zn/Cd) transporter
MMSNKHNKLHNKALLLEYITITWNILEGLVSMALGLMAGSVSLFAYGLESSVEVFASSVTVWELKGVGRGREKKALRMIGYAYLIVALYIVIDTIKSLILGNQADHSPLGITFMAITVVVMIILGVLKNTVGKKMGNNVVIADARFTLIDAGLSSTVLVGLILNLLFGWWWTDPILAFFLAGAAFREGLKEVVN